MRLIEFLRKKNTIHEVNKDWVLNHPTFCMMPWVHFHVTQQGTVTPCCQAPWQKEHAFGNINESSIEEIWNSPKMGLFRANMLEGKKDFRCERCYEKEVSGWRTLRQITNENYTHHIQRVKDTQPNGQLKNTPPVYFDLRFSNVCNFRCRICGPWSSSKWHKDGLELGMTSASSAITRSIISPSKVLEEFEENIDQVEEIYFAGGEPLMMDEHYQILELLIKHSKFNVKLMYNTNLSKLGHKNWDAIALWNKFSHINIAASLDAMGNRAEFLRKEQNWNETINNLTRLKAQTPHVSFMISPTVCIMNVFHLFEFHKYMVEEKHITVEDFIPSLLIQPEYYNIRVLPKKLKNQLSELIDTHLTWLSSSNGINVEKKEYVIQTFNNLKIHLHSGDQSHLLQEFKQKTKMLDTIRAENFKDVFPELQSLYST